MTGMSCGTRVCGLVALTALTSAFAPALARADATGGGLPVATPPAVTAVSTPAPAASAPATPSVPAPALPAASGPAAAATQTAASTAVNVKSTVGGTATLDPATGSLTIHAPMTKASVSKSDGSVNVGASKIVKPITTTASNHVAKVTGNKHAKKATAKAVQVVKKGSRVLAWNDADSGDPMQGCKDGKYTACTMVPFDQTPVMIDNRCWDWVGPNSSTFSMPDDGGDSTGTPPPYGPDLVTFTQGREVVWTKTDTTPTGLRIHSKVFLWGLYGVGNAAVGDTAVYRLGHDFQDEWEVFVPMSLFGSSIKKLTQDLLIVDRHTITPAPNMVYTEHAEFGANGDVTIKWHIVCHVGQTGDANNGHDHDRSGDYDKYKHNHGDYHGYNDDPPSSWDQND